MDDTKEDTKPNLLASKSRRHMVKSPRDPDVMAHASELRADFDLPTAAATRLAMLKLTKVDEDLYDSLLRGVTLAASGFPIVKVSRMAKPSTKSNLRLSDGQVLLCHSGVFRQSKERIALATSVLSLELGYKAIDADPFVKYFKNKDLDPAAYLDRVAVMNTPERQYCLIFENERAARLFHSVIQLHQGIGHKCFDLQAPLTSNVLYYGDAQ